MKLIAHRGNVDGPEPDEENKPHYLLKAIGKGYFVELDLWYQNDRLYLGHDTPQYEIDFSFLSQNQDKLFVHCKNIGALHFILENAPSLECFFHDSDDCVLTSKGNIWTYPGKQLTNRSICVMPERVDHADYDITGCLGVCSDFVYLYGRPAHLK